MNIVIVGGSAAGAKTASKLRRLDEHVRITVIQKSHYLSMASCGYPYYVGGVFDDRNMLISTPTGGQRDASFFSKVKNIEALVATEATAIDRDAKTMSIRSVDTGEAGTVAYDKLVIATGATPVVPRLPGIELRNVTTFQTLEEADFLKQVVVTKSAKRAVVIGGGLIGIEACEALELAGVDITLVEAADQILPFLDPELARLVENHLRDNGSTLRLGTTVTELIGEAGKVVGARLTTGETIPCDLVVVAIGVRPNGGLGHAAGLQIGPRGGILVNRFMQTSDPSIYAAGDCVEVTNLMTQTRQPWPMGDAANLQGRVVAQNLLSGNTEEYEGFVGTGICKVFDYSAGGTGLSEKAARAEGYSNIITAIHAAADKPGFMGAKPLIIKMVADRTTGRFLGMQAVGTGDVSKRVAMGAMALHARFTVSDMVSLDLPYAPPFSPAIDNFVQAVHVLENKWRGLMDGISCSEVEGRVRAGEPLFLLDVRSPQEFDTERLGLGETLIPLGQLRSRVDELPKDRNQEIVTYCRISLRGYEAACLLRSLGYTKVKVMEGGLLAWPFALKRKGQQS